MPQTIITVSVKDAHLLIPNVVTLGNGVGPIMLQLYAKGIGDINLYFPTYSEFEHWTYLLHERAVVYKDV